MGRQRAVHGCRAGRRQGGALSRRRDQPARSGRPGGAFHLGAERGGRRRQSPLGARHGGAQILSTTGRRCKAGGNRPRDRPGGEDDRPAAQRGAAHDLPQRRALRSASGRRGRRLHHRQQQRRCRRHHRRRYRQRACDPAPVEPCDDQPGARLHPGCRRCGADEPSRWWTRDAASNRERRNRA